MSKEFIKPKKILLSEYEIQKTIGQGAFGKVKLARHKKNKNYVALKKQVDHVISENTILFNCKHPFIVHMEGFSQNEKYLTTIMEFINGGELFTYLRNVGRLESSHAIFYSAQVTCIFEYLHSMDVIYRDLKPENLLIQDNGYLKLVDFGFAKIVSGRTYTLCGTPEYLAPEILLNKGHGKAVDWWTLGILIYELNAGIDPFTDEDPMGIYQKILKGKIRFPRGFDKSAKSLVRHLVVADLSKRYGNLKNGILSYFDYNCFIGVKDIKTHRWFKNLDWDLILKMKLVAPYKPQLKAPNDTSYFQELEESQEEEVQAVKAADDPFMEWE